MKVGLDMLGNQLQQPQPVQRPQGGSGGLQGLWWDATWKLAVTESLGGQWEGNVATGVLAGVLSSKMVPMVLLQCQSTQQIEDM